MTATARKFTILVADDAPEYRQLVDKTLTKQACSVLFASDGRETMDLFLEHRPDLVIMDWVMPNLGGLELCQRLRAGFGNSYAYIIILTGRAEQSELLAALAAGADDYLTKPFIPDELVARVGVGRRIVEFHREVEAKNRLLKELALTDSLTGLPNRRALEAWAATELTAALRHGFSFWVAMADLDHFKAINDSFGHVAGDQVLKSFAEILKACSRSSDLCCRIGGEEFLVVFTHTDVRGALVAVDRIREQFARQAFTFGARHLAVTASFGIAGIDEEVQDFNQLVMRADSALYCAKRLGRNRVALAPAGAADCPPRTS